MLPSLASWLFASGTAGIQPLSHWPASQSFSEYTPATMSILPPAGIAENVTTSGASCAAGIGPACVIVVPPAPLGDFGYLTCMIQWSATNGQLALCAVPAAGSGVT